MRADLPRGIQMIQKLAGAFALLGACGCAYAQVGFQPAVKIADGVAGRLLVQADVNGDRRNDIVLLSTGPDAATTRKLVVLFRNLDGSYAPPAIHDIGWTQYSYNQSLASGDIDNDGDPDFVAHNLNNDGELVVMRNDGSGGFTLASLNLGDGTVELKIVDIDGDGNRDLSVNHMDSGIVQIAYGDGQGGFPTRGTATATISTSSYELVDVDGDGLRDLTFATIVHDSTHGYRDEIWIRWNTGNGFTNSPTRIRVPSLYFGLADLDGNGTMDVLGYPQFGGATLARSFLQTSPRKFGRPVPGHVDDVDGREIDIDSDGHVDIVHPGGSWISYMRGRGDGRFDRLARRFTSVYGVQHFLDLDADGRLDLLTLADGAAYASYADGEPTGPDLALSVDADSNGMSLRITNIGNLPSAEFVVDLRTSVRVGSVHEQDVPAGCNSEGVDPDAVKMYCQLPALAPGESDVIAYGHYVLGPNNFNVLSVRAKLLGEPDMQVANDTLTRQIPLGTALGNDGTPLRPRSGASLRQVR
jgi:hypothetical protein